LFKIMFAQLLVVFAVIACACAKTSWRQLSADYSFEKFVEEFEYEWKVGTAEWNQRRSIFVEELARVIKHNANPMHTWKEGINKFSAMTPAEKKAFRGRSKAINRAHKPKYGQELPSTFKLKHVSELPTSVDWRSVSPSIVTAVKDQGYCGSCWAFASTAVIESAVAQASGLLFDFSPQQIAMCSPNPDSCGGTGGCEGATAELAFDYVVGSSGLYQEYQLPYSAYGGKDSACGTPAIGGTKASIKGYVYLPENNYTALMNAVATVGPIAVSVDASWGGYESGIFAGCTGTPDIDHAVVLMGYGEENGQKYWTVRNSWSPSWGEEGYIRLARSDSDESNCGVDTTPQDGTACAGDDTPVTVCGACGILYDSSYPTGAYVF
jgi:cathepsin L